VSPYFSACARPIHFDRDEAWRKQNQAEKKNDGDDNLAERTDLFTSQASERQAPPAPPIGSLVTADIRECKRAVKRERRRRLY
jgi:hypothetical protein